MFRSLRINSTKYVVFSFPICFKRVDKGDSRSRGTLNPICINISLNIVNQYYCQITLNSVKLCFNVALITRQANLSHDNDAMKYATLDQEMEALEVRGYVSIPDRPAFSLAMIAKLLDIQCPMTSVSLRTVQRAAEYLTAKKAIFPCSVEGNTPYYNRFHTEVIIVKLKFRIKN